MFHAAYQLKAPVLVKPRSSGAGEHGQYTSLNDCLEADDSRHVSDRMKLKPVKNGQRVPDPIAFTNQ